MTDHEQAVFEVWIWFVLVFATTMLIPWFWRRITTQNDAIAEADQATAEANLIIDEFESIESYLDDWAPGLSTRTAIAETRALDQDRA